ncbi:MAG: hypothetical protein ACI9VR_002800 [Cognaticolwellia sp.]|jgi:hypothetical protein
MIGGAMIWLWLACTATPDEPTATDTGSTLPGAEQPVIEPEWDAADLEYELTWLLSQGFPNSRQAMALYLEVMSHGDSICPGNKEYIDATNLRGCVADSGYYYSGVSTYERQALTEPDGSQISFEGSTGDYLFRNPEGQEMEGGGHQTLAVVVDPLGEVNNVFSEHSGSFAWAAHDGVYREKVSGSLQVVAVKYTESRQLNIQGAISYLGHSLFFQTDLWEDCGWNTNAGVIEVRDPSGGWYTLGPQSCESNCMTATFDGELQGEVCVDLSPIAQAFEPELDLLQ